ncbi:UV-stimulated scaffold protein A isoform X4 [Vanacampus margaritifer]
MELSQRDRLSELVEELTTSGQLQINREKMMKVKKICKDSNDCINHVYHSLMSQLNQDHAEIRLSAFQITIELFPKSHHFRTLLVDNFQELLELTVETNFQRPLPPPQPVARKLRSLAVQTIQSWQSSYGSAYKKLELGYHFLKQFKKVDFQDTEARTAVQRERETERQRKMQRIYNERLKAAIRDLEDSSPDIEMALTELDSCLKLLFPQFHLLDSLTTNSCLLTQQTTGCLLDDEIPCCSKILMNDRTEKIQESKERMRKEETDIDNGEEGEENKNKKRKHKRCENKELNKSDKQKKGEIEGQRYKMKHEDKEAEEQDPLHGDCFIRNSGLISRSYSLKLNLSPGLHVEETEDNEAVVSTVLDLKRLLITKYLPAVSQWVQVFTKSGADQHLLKRALDLKKSLEDSLLKLSELNIDKSSVIKMDNTRKEKAWNEVAAALGYTANDCKSRWRQLRDSFVKHKKETSLPSGSSGGTQKDWKHAVLIAAFPPTSPGSLSSGSKSNLRAMPTPEGVEGERSETPSSLGSPAPSPLPPVTTLNRRRWKGLPGPVVPGTDHNIMGNGPGGREIHPVICLLWRTDYWVYSRSLLQSQACLTRNRTRHTILSSAQSPCC